MDVNAAPAVTEWLESMEGDMPLGPHIYIYIHVLSGIEMYTYRFISIPKYFLHMYICISIYLYICICVYI